MSPTKSERSAALAALLSAATMIAQQVGSKATRDALFLSSFDSDDLPRAVLAAALASLIGVFAASRAYARFGPARAVPLTFAISASLYAGEWVWQPRAERTVAVVLFLHTAVFGALVISGFWSVVNERFDPHAAKKVVRRIGVGATLGGVFGGLLAERFGEWGNARAMLAALAVLNGLAALGVMQIGRGTRAPHSDEPAKSAWTVLRDAPYLRALAGLIVLTAVSSAFVDYAFKSEAAAYFERGSDSLLRFFALFHVGAAVLSFVLQTTVAKPLLSRLGVAANAAILPATLLMTSLVAAAVTRLATAMVANASDFVLGNSVFRNGYELLYTPVAAHDKRPTKALIDVAGSRVGDALGSGVIMVVLALLPHPLVIRCAFAAAALAAVASLLITRRLHRGYVAELATRLREGTPVKSAQELWSDTALQTLSTLGLDREALFEALAARAPRPLAHAQDERSPATEVVPSVIEGPADDPIHEKARTLRGDDVDAIRKLLGERPLDVRLAESAIDLLARREVYRDAVEALRAVVDEVVAPLAGALADADRPFAVRRRIPRVLAASTRGSEAVAALERGLDDERFEVRYRCAIALARIASREPTRRPHSDRVHEVVARELEAGRRVWDSRRLMDDEPDDDAPLLERALSDRVHRSVEHVFTLLSLAYDAQPLWLSLAALAGTDRALRGTALEYLESVLPEPIRDVLFPMLDAKLELRRRRTREEIVDELTRTAPRFEASAGSPEPSSTKPPEPPNAE